MIDEEKTELALLLGKVIGKQDAMHKDVKAIDEHIKESNGRLAEVEHTLLAWRNRFITGFLILAAAAPIMVEESRAFLVNIITGG